MSRVGELERRRRALLARCDEQRGELAYRLAQVRPAQQLSAFTGRAPGMGLGLALNNPVALIAAIAGAVALFRPKRMLGLLSFATGAMGLMSRATAIWKVFQSLKSLRRGFR
jgi:hypothetical protein